MGELKQVYIHLFSAHFQVREPHSIETETVTTTETRGKNKKLPTCIVFVYIYEKKNIYIEYSIYRAWNDRSKKDKRKAKRGNFLFLIVSLFALQCLLKIR